jgi:hypothetical protein
MTAIGMVCLLISMAIAYYYESLYNWRPTPTPMKIIFTAFGIAGLILMLSGIITFVWRHMP